MSQWKMSFPDGLNLAKQLRELPEAFTREIVLAALEAGAVPVKEQSAHMAPRGPDAPHLADSFAIQRLPQTRSERDADVPFGVAVGPQKDFFYGSFWEFGWRYHSARPFMRPAFDEKALVALQIIGQELWAGLREFKKTGNSASPGGTGSL